MSERIFGLQHQDCFGCLKPRCNFIYTRDEIQSYDMEDYLLKHKYNDSPLEDYHLESKIWTIDEIVNVPEIFGWHPGFWLFNNGFLCIADIDIFDLFGTPKEPFQKIGKHDLKKKKSELEAIFERLDYKKQELIVYRTKRTGINNWDAIDVFSIGCYHNSKEIMRDQIIQDLIVRDKEISEKYKKSWPLRNFNPENS